MYSTYNSILQERLAQYNIDSFTVEEIISIITGISVSKVKHASNLYGLLEIPKYIDSMKLSDKQKKVLELLFEFCKRLNTSILKEKDCLNSSTKAGEYFIKELQFQKNEVFLVAMLDAQNRLINTVKVSNGTINEACVYPRDIVKYILDNNANSVILAHNHPGGSQNPSSADINVTQKIIQALKTISVNVIDHIIVADNSFTSFAEKGLLDINP